MDNVSRTCQSAQTRVAEQVNPLKRIESWECSEVRCESHKRILKDNVPLWSDRTSGRIQHEGNGSNIIVGEELQLYIRVEGGLHLPTDCDLRGLSSTTEYVGTAKDIVKFGKRKTCLKP
mmetsp:Transcript_25532/g.60387  ORF Transcript_25532/g.60387 Transcript_25532/m.60387 type:complete len:119 (+) Transcript_25532:268-624(+)